MSSFIGQSAVGVIPAQNDGLTGLWRNIARHKLLFAAIFGTCCFAGGLYILLATPQYRADALLRVQIKPGASVSALSDVSGTTSADQSADDETDVLTSRTIVGEAIKETGADINVQTDSHFPVIGRFLASRHAAATELSPPLLGLSGYAWGGEQLKPGIFEVPGAALGDKFRVVTGEAGSWTLYDKDSHQLAQGRVGQTVPFQVTTDDGTAPGQLRIDVLRARPGVEFTLSKVSMQTAYENVSNQLKTTVSSQNSSIRDSSMMRLSYQASSPITAQLMVNTIVQAFVKRNIDDRATQARVKLETLRAHLPQLEADMHDAENRFSDFRTQHQAIDMEQQGAALISTKTALAERQRALQLDRDDKQQTFGPDSPVIRGLDQQLAQIRLDLAKNTDEVKNLPATQREYVRLSSDAGIKKQLYVGVLANINQLEVAAASTASGVSIMDWAIASEKPSWPRKTIILLGSILAGLFGGTLAVHLVSLNRKELRTPQEINIVSDLPRLAVVARSKAQLRGVADSRGRPDEPVKLLAVSSPGDPSVEALRSLPSSVRALLAGNANGLTNKVVLFTGPTQGVGKSFVSSNFAYLLSQTEASVLLIDGDMRQGKLSRLWADQDRPGLAEVLKGTAQLEDAIVRNEGSHLSILGAGEAYPSNPAELLSSPAFRGMLATLRERYDYVVIDSPPVLPVSDAVSIAAQGCDLVLLVSRADYTGSRQVEEALQRLANVGAKVGGHIFNGFLPSRYGERDDYALNGARRY
ncbi:polysaccharide biosynthesis tyrosine autokinase [Paraburkholderia fungorum]|uniref:polysaccharide biosynthesis tyrosine autokinase n=1 Tax=Paraburkholderia fungorum TaxID=134537 RepID=UPI000E77EDA8|nr:polysaccharide biosynthesis tyrosine autokinase [Paraburkholderia fungorum]